MTALRVLVVEDEPTIASLLLEMLRDEGFEVQHAADGVDALELLHTWLPNAILLDLTLPRLDGWGFRAAQRDLPEPLCSVPVIVMSGVRYTDRLDTLDAAAVIPKPFDIEELIATLKATTGG